MHIGQQMLHFCFATQTLLLSRSPPRRVASQHPYRFVVVRVNAGWITAYHRQTLQGVPLFEVPRTPLRCTYTHARRFDLQHLSFSLPSQ
jgi:hypothetical protein